MIRPDLNLEEFLRESRKTVSFKKEKIFGRHLNILFLQLDIFDFIRLITLCLFEVEIFNLKRSFIFTAYEFGEKSIRPRVKCFKLIP